MKKLIIPGLALILIILLATCLLTSNEKQITNQNEIDLIKEEANLDTIINLDNFSKENYSEEKLLDVAMQYAAKLNLLNEASVDDTYLQYIAKDELHNLIFELTGLRVVAPIEIEDFYYLYDSENEYYYWIGFSPAYYKISKINSIKRNGHTYTVNCSAEKSEDGEKISKDNITVRLELKKENQLIKYQVLEIK